METTALGSPRRGMSPMRLAMLAARCLVCGSPRLSSSARVCPSCGRFYPSSGTAPCPKCAELIPRNVYACLHCGASLRRASEAAQVGIAVAVNVILLLGVLSTAKNVFPAPSVFFGLVTFGLMGLTYLSGGVVLGLGVPSHRWLPQIVTAVGVATCEAVLWASEWPPLALMVATASEFLVSLALIHLGSLPGNAIGHRIGYLPLPKSGWADYVNAVLLVFGASLLRTIVGRILK